MVPNNQRHYSNDCSETTSEIKFRNETLILKSNCMHTQLHLLNFSLPLLKTFPLLNFALI